MIAMLAAVPAAIVDDRLRDRYRHLADHADAGLGAEEFETCRRYTRPTETPKAPDSPAKKSPRANDQNIQQEDQSHAE